MTHGKIRPRILVLLCMSLVALAAGGVRAAVAMSEFDSYTQALTSASRDDALAFIREFPASPLVDDLIESLPAVVAPQVCTDLGGGGPPLAQDACKKFQGPPAVATAIISAPVVTPVPTPLKLTDPSDTAGSVCEYASCKANAAAPAGKSSAAPASAGAAAPNGAKIGGSLNASGSGSNPDATTRGDVSSTASGTVTGSVGDTRSGTVDGSLGTNLGDTGSGNVDGDIGATIGNSDRATVGGSIGGSVGADSDGRGVDGDMRGGVKARLFF